MIQPEPEGSTQGYPLDSVEVLRSILMDSKEYIKMDMELKTRKDRGMKRGRHSTSSSSAFNQPSSSHLNDDDDDRNDEGASHASTPSPTHFVSSLTNDVP
ncbi:hypothetical protein Tco_0883325 [Tanacetum coccineum]